MTKQLLCTLVTLLLLFAVPTQSATSGDAKTKGKPDPVKSIEAGLVWLARHQNEDGSWGAKSLEKRCKQEPPCFDPKAKFHEHYDEGLTGLALLAFLRAGKLPSSTEELADPLTGTSHKPGDVVTRGFEWLKKRQGKSGTFCTDRSFLYNDAIAELAIVEAYVSTKDERWKEPAQRGATFLAQAQRRNPSGTGAWGWRYSAREDTPEKDKFDSDTSATGWATVALAAARAAGLDVPKESFDGALAFLDSVSVTTGLVGYVDAKQAGMKVTGLGDHFDYHAGVMSALGIGIRLSAGIAPTHAFFAAAAQHIVKDPPRVSADKLSVDYYYWYQGSLALNHLQDHPASKKSKKKYADAWNKALIETACQLQDGTKERCSAGGWVVADRWSLNGGPIYSTATCVLALEVCAPRK